MGTGQGTGTILGPGSNSNYSWDANDWEATHTQIRCHLSVTLNSDTPRRRSGDRQRGSNLRGADRF